MNLKIGMVNAYCVQHGGIGRHIYETSQYLGKNIEIITSFNGFENAQQQIRVLPIERDGKFLSIQEMVSFSSEVNRVKSDYTILHLHGVYDVKPSIYTAHICLASTFKLIQKYYGLSVLKGFVPDYQKVLDMERKLFAVISEKQTLAVSHYLANSISSEYGFNETNIELVTNAIRPLKEASNSLHQVTKKQRKFRIGTIGRNFYAKGLGFMCHTLSNLVSRGIDVECVFVGCVDETIKEISKFLQKNKLTHLEPHIITIPQIDIGEDFFYNLDCYLCLSLFDSYSLSVLEAFATGTPVISTDYSGVFYDARITYPDLELAHVNNLEDYAAIADLVERIFFDEVYRSKVVQNGYSISNAKSWKTIAQIYEKKYLKILNEI